jgi:hypothetical protein
MQGIVVHSTLIPVMPPPPRVAQHTPPMVQLAGPEQPIGTPASHASFASQVIPKVVDTQHDCVAGAHVVGPQGMPPASTGGPGASTPAVSGRPPPSIVMVASG